MGTKETKVFKALLKYLFPTLTKAAVSLLEEIIQQDLNNDGKVGFKDDSNN